MNDEHDTNDAFLSPIEAYALRVKLRKAQARIAALEAQLEFTTKRLHWMQHSLIAVNKRLHARIAELERKAEREHDQRIRVAKALLREKDNTRRIGDLETRIRVLEGALTPFADACADDDIASGHSKYSLYTLDWSEGEQRHVAILTSHGGLLEIGHLRAAYETLHGKPAPTPAQDTPPEPE